MRTTRWTASLLVVGAFGAALGITGGAQAAGLITGQQIKDGTVAGVDLRDGTITTRDVAGGSISTGDIAGDETGLPGPRGQQGRTGQPGLEVVGLELSEGQQVGPGVTATQYAICDEGRVAVGGGLLAAADASRLQLLDSAPLGPAPESRNGWAVRAHNPVGNPDAGMLAWVVCAEVL